MIIKIHSTSDVVGENKGGSATLVSYLEKEDRGIDALEQDGFFNGFEDHIPGTTVEQAIDFNKGRLGRDETKFYMLTVNPSQDEIRHIGEDEAKLKSYVNDLMEEYAKNFNRVYRDGRPLSGNDIMYFAKVEHERTYKFSERRYRATLQHNAKVKNEIIKHLGDPKKKAALEKHYIRNSQGTPILEGAKKDGNNMHVHIIVSRYDYQQKFKLSPLSSHRGGTGIVDGRSHSRGFNRDAFVCKAEALFDQKFNYNRAVEQSYNYRLTNGLLLGPKNPKTLAKIIVKRAMMEAIEDKTLQRATQIAVSDPRKLPKKWVAKIEKEAIKSVMAALDATAYTNPVSAGLSIAKKTITLVGRALAQSASI